jgi:hypothetical protein
MVPSGKSVQSVCGYTFSIMSFSGMLLTMDCAIFLGTADSPLAFKSCEKNASIKGLSLEQLLSAGMPGVRGVGG